MNRIHVKENPDVPYRGLSVTTKILLEIQHREPPKKGATVRITDAQHGYYREIEWNKNYDSAEGVAMSFIFKSFGVMAVARVGTENGVGLIYDYMQGDQSLAKIFWDWLRKEKNEKN